MLASAWSIGQQAGFDVLNPWEKLLPLLHKTDHLLEVASKLATPAPLCERVPSDLPTQCLVVKEA